MIYLVILYFALGALLAMALGLIKDFGAFCSLVTVLVGWPFYIIIIAMVSIVCGLAKAVDSFRGGAR